MGFFVLFLGFLMMIMITVLLKLMVTMVTMMVMMAIIERRTIPSTGDTMIRLEKREAGRFQLN